ncbi:Holliday junction resolvase RuvX [candidate division KSB1 bacterium]|nr:Holliday junction resolvase RuvX [candidate division KSB1 bacterium]
MISNSLLNDLPSGRILSVDYGQIRIGLAMSDPFQILSSPLCTLKNSSVQKSINEILDIVKKHEIIAIVIGLPINMNGTIGNVAKDVQNFMNILAQKTHVSVFSWDERWTTVSAEKSLIAKNKSPSKNRDRIDQIASAFLLQAFLDRLNHVRNNKKTLSDTNS